MNRDRVRMAIAIAAVAAMGAVMMYGVLGLSPVGSYPGPYGDILNRVTVMQRHALNVATAINFDYRGFDTLLEEYILFTAVAGVTLLFREQLGPHERVTKEPDTDNPIAPASDGIGWVGYGLVPMGALFAVYIAIHGQLTPGGGFQAGAIAASVFALVYFGQEYATATRFLPREAGDALESIGAAGYGIVGAVTAITSGMFLENTLPLGKTGDIVSAGTIPVINAFVFLEVSFGLIVALELFMAQTRKTEKEE